LALVIPPFVTLMIELQFASVLAMGDDKHVYAGRERVNRLHHGMFSACIKGTGRFVEHDDVSILIQRSGESDLLSHPGRSYGKRWQLERW